MRLLLTVENKQAVLLRCRIRGWVVSLTVTPTLHTKRLVLEPYTPVDEDGFVALFQGTRVSRWMGDGLATEAADRALFGRIFTKVYAQALFEVWAVRRGEHLIGHAVIKPTEIVAGHEIIDALAPAAWDPVWGPSSPKRSSPTASTR